MPTEVTICLGLRQFKMQISQKQFDIEAWYQSPTNRKWPMADQMMTSSTTSCDLEMSNRDPNIFIARYFEISSR